MEYEKYFDAWDTDHQDGMCFRRFALLKWI